MGEKFYITRANFWAENKETQITPETWLAFIDSDSDLTRETRNGDYHTFWSGPSSYKETWLDWSDGNIYTKWPDTQLYRKMLEIAECPKARVMDDDGNIYSPPSDREYGPGRLLNVRFWHKADPALTCFKFPTAYRQVESSTHSLTGSVMLFCRIIESQVAQAITIKGIIHHAVIYPSS